MKKIAVLGLVVAILCVYFLAVAQKPDKSASPQPAASSLAQSEKPPQAEIAASATLKTTDTLLASSVSAGQGGGMAAIAQASAAGKYLFVFFFKADDDNTVEMRKVFDGAMAKIGDKADPVVIKISDPVEKEIVAKYGVTTAPMPLVLAVAPNGAVTGGFPTRIDEKDLLDAFASPVMEKCLKALQEGKLVFVCVHNNATKSNERAMKGVNEFKADARFGPFTEIVQVDPTDAAESKFLASLQIEPKTDEAITAFLAPPGALIAKYKGATDKDTLVAAIMAASSGGCGSGGCGPSGCN